MSQKRFAEVQVIECKLYTSEEQWYIYMTGVSKKCFAMRYIECEPRYVLLTYSFRALGGPYVRLAV